MSWHIKFTTKAQNVMNKFDKSVKKQIDKFLLRLTQRENPRSLGSALSGTLAGRWRYRVGDYRIICEFHDDVLLVLVLDIGHRSEIYKR